MTSDEKNRDDPLRRVGNDEIAAAIRDAPAPVVNTGYLAGEFETSTESMRERLDELVADGVLERAEARGRGHLWWCTVETELGE
ncbi:hypothetical protein [Haladaptatus salinisoli]|uniref:hypothetical protein n=1 Tax=Haladaptatus salinisoli TaxID=2884876 RepID=UPI001D0AA4D6|nr:hypothetical protein [Haladaptatus salinisoli]